MSFVLLVVVVRNDFNISIIARPACLPTAISACSAGTWRASPAVAFQHGGSLQGHSCRSGQEELSYGIPSLLVAVVGMIKHAHNMK